MPHDVIPAYDFLIYLRHHGFPSPLLDWTASAQIAAFFAFRDAASEARAVSVYAFCEYAGGGKLRSSSAPSISSCGPYTRGHQRHFLQQAQYTICTVFRSSATKDEVKQYFAPHEDAVAKGSPGDPSGLQQDWMWKIDVPAAERGKALKNLAEYNLNAFSLFASTESLAETLGLQYFGPSG